MYKHNLINLCTDILKKNNINYTSYQAKTGSYYIHFEGMTIRISDHFGNDRNNLDKIILDLTENEYYDIPKLEKKLLDIISNI